MPPFDVRAPANIDVAVVRADAATDMRGVETDAPVHGHHFARDIRAFAEIDAAVHGVDTLRDLGAAADANPPVHGPRRFGRDVVADAHAAVHRSGCTNLRSVAHVHTAIDGGRTLSRRTGGHVD
ncbi:MAG: hypothetical protein WDO56_36520 [Gammaproteobacteria bacterium]